MTEKTPREILDAIDKALKETAVRVAAAKPKRVPHPPQPDRPAAPARPKTPREILDAIDKAPAETARQFAIADTDRNYGFKFPARILPRLEQCGVKNPCRCAANIAISAIMASRDSAHIEITPEVLLKAYACGIFPMAENADDPALYWIEPELRGIIPLDGFHVPARLARTVRTEPFTVVCNRDFEAVIDGCAEPGPGRSRTWINGRIRKLYRKLYDIGHCHTVEVYDEDTLVGGLYGVSLGRTFFGESMFHRARDASKIALVHLVARLRAGGFKLLDTQFITQHLKTFGATEVQRRHYHKLLADALVGEADFAIFPLATPLPGAIAVAHAAARSK